MKGSLEIVLSVLPVLSLFVLGHILQRIRFFREGTVQDIKKLVVSIALPCLLFLAFSQLQIQLKFLVVVLLVFGVCGLMILIGKILSRPLGIQSPYFSLMFGGFETGMLGYAIFISVYGIENIDKIAIIDLGQVLFVFFVLMALLIRQRDGTQEFGQLGRMFISSPVIIAIFLGIFVSLLKMAFGDFTEQRFYAYIIELATVLGNMTVPGICLVIGYELAVDFKTLSLSLKTIAFRTLLLLGFAVAINKLLFASILQLDVMYEYALLTMFILPPPFVIAVFMDEKDRENQQYVVNTLSLSTVVSLVVFVIVMMVYR